MLRRIPARLRRLALIAVLGVLGGVGASAGMQAHGASAAPASPNDFAFDSMDVAYTLGVDDHGRAVLDVTETLIAKFPNFDQNHGILRAIPDRYDGHPLDLDVQRVTDGAGTALEYETSHDEDDSNLVVLKVGDAERFVHGSQTYVIQYRLHNVIHQPTDADIDEFYWDVNGTGWAQPFGHVRATLTLSPAIAERTNAQLACYAGYTGATKPCTSISRTGNVITADGGALDIYENLTIAVGFDAGTFVPRDDALGSTISGVATAVGGIGAVGTVIAAIVLRRTRWRDHPGRGTIIAQYEPQPGVGLLTAAYLVKQPGKGIAAAIIELAVNGNVRIIERARRKYNVELVSAAGVGGEGASVLAAVFGGGAAPGTQVAISRSNTTLGRALSSVRSAASARIVPSGLRRKPKREGIGPLAFTALGMSSLGTFAGFAAMDQAVGGGIPVLAVGASWVSFATIVGLLGNVRPLTEQGRAARDHLDGLRLYIRLAEADRLRMLQSPDGALRDPRDPAVVKLNERLLPYAVLFGLESEWSAVLATAYTEGTAPTWYAGSTAFNYTTFSRSVASFAGITSSSWSGSSSSSSSSGSSGGGSSGGGGGGGGGGGW